MRLASRPAILTLTLLCFLPLALRFLDHVSDDAFISLRYAENLAHGRGLVFNPGERVEGYTNFLWVVLLAPASALSLEPQTSASLLGLVAACALLAAVAWLSPTSTAAPEVRWIAPLFAATSPPLAVWATGGLEGPLFGALVLWAVVLTIGAAGEARLHPGAALCAALATLTRPEGLLVGAALFAAAWATGARRPREVGLWWAGFLAVVVPFWVWRTSYYGDLLPNTFYAKVGWNAAQLGRGLRYVGSFLAESGYVLPVPLVGLVLGRSVRRDPALVVTLAVAATLAASTIFVGGDSLPMYRFLVPVLPLFHLLLARGFAAAIERSGARPSVRVALACGVLVLAAFAARPAFAGRAARLVDVDRREVAAWKEIGRYFAEHARPDRSIAVVTAGAIPYYSKLTAIDMLGLTERAIARRAMPGLGQGPAGHEKFDVEHVLERRPSFVVLGTYGLAPDARPAPELLRPFYPAEIELLRSERFLAEYVLVRARASSGYFAYFRRRDET